jgi:hypothetical protein
MSAACPKSSRRSTDKAWVRAAVGSFPEIRLRPNFRTARDGEDQSDKQTAAYMSPKLEVLDGVDVLHAPQIDPDWGDPDEKPDR